MFEGSSNVESNTNRVLCGGKWVSVQDIEEQYGKQREDAAASFHVSVSTFRRNCKKLGIKRWPYPKRESSRIGHASVLHSSSHSCEETSQPPQMEETSSQNNDIRIRQAEAVVGNNIPNSVIEPSLESISTDQPIIDNLKLHFDNLIALALEDLSDPEKETSMNNTLSSLEDNLSLFSEEQADQILELLFEFPALVHRWRVYNSQFQKYSQKYPAQKEKIRDLAETSESLKVRHEQLEKERKELMRRLEEVQKEKAEIAEQRIEKSKQTKELKEKEARGNKEERLTRIATTKLSEFSHQWAKRRSSFI